MSCRTFWMRGFTATFMLQEGHRLGGPQFCSILVENLPCGPHIEIGLHSSSQMRSEFPDTFSPITKKPARSRPESEPFSHTAKNIIKSLTICRINV